jgi:hypothetical protein
VSADVSDSVIVNGRPTSNPPMPLLRFPHIVVSPYRTLLDPPEGEPLMRGGPHWPDFDRQTVARHCRDCSPVDSEPVPASGEPRTLPVTAAWGGPLHGHYGHQLADFSMRLAPTLMAMPDASFVVTGLAGDTPRTWDELPASTRQIFEWFALTPSRVHLLTEPTLVEALLVAPQAEQLGYQGPAPAPEYLAFLECLAERHLGPPERAGTVYVSRAGMVARMAGAAYLADLMSQAGVVVIRPETLPLREQLRAYRNAERLIFEDGSAAHTLQLLGGGLGDVSILHRRPGVGPFYAVSVRPRARHFHWVEVLRGFLTPYRPSGAHISSLGMGIPDEALLLGALPELLGNDSHAATIRAGWNSAAFADAIERDLTTWSNQLGMYMNLLCLPTTTAAITDGLAEAGLPHLSSLLAATLSANREAPPGTSALDEEYAAERGRLAAAIGHHVPAEARFVLVDKGDEVLLDTFSTRAVLAPAGADGTWIGYAPADSDEARAMLDASWPADVAYLVFTSGSLWWLEYYDALARELARRCDVVASIDGLCRILRRR